MRCMARRSFSVRLEPFLRPILRIEQLAQWRSRLAIGHRHQAARSGPDGCEQTRVSIIRGPMPHPAGQVLSAVCPFGSNNNLASRRPAPLCPERGQLGQECRSEGRGFAGPRPGWDASPPWGGETRSSETRGACSTLGASRPQAFERRQLWRHADRSAWRAPAPLFSVRSSAAAEKVPSRRFWGGSSLKYLPRNDKYGWFQT